MNRQFNFRFLAIVLVLFAVSGVTLFFLHSRQQDRIAEALHQQAEALMTAGDHVKAAGYYERYLKMKPHDSVTYSKYALLMFQVAKTNEDKIKALSALDKAVIKDPENFELRRKLVELAIIPGLDEITRPEPHLVRLLERFPKETKLVFMLAVRLFQEGKYPEAVIELDKLIQLDPSNLDAYFRKAAIQRVNLNAIKQAEQTLADMVKANNTADAYLLSSHYWRQYGTAAQVSDTVEKAAKLEPDNAAVLIAMSELAIGQNRLDEARKHLLRCRKLHPKEITALQALAALDLEAGKPNDAIQSLKEALEINRDREDLYFALAEAYLRAEKFEQAGELIQALRRKEYRPVLIQLLEAQVFASKGEWVKATRLFEDALPQVSEFGPIVRQCYLVLARCYEQIGDVDNRIAAYRRVVGDDPMNFTANYNLARTLSDQGRVEEALALLNERGINRTESGLLLFAELLLKQQLALPINQRNWAGFDDIFKQAEEKTPASVQLALMKYRRQLAADHDQAARLAIEQAQQRWPKDVDLWAARVEMELVRRQLPQARKALDDARAALGDLPKLRVLDAQQLLMDGLPKDTKALDQITDSMTGYLPNQQLELLRLMMELRLRYGDLAGAIRLADQQDKLLPHDLSLQLIRFDLATRSENESRMKEIIEKIKQLEGPGGVYAPLANALFIMWKSTKTGDVKNLDQAAVYLAAIGKKRSDWPRLHLAEGKLRELQGDTLSTLASYQQAVSRGSRDIDAIAWMMQTYYRQQRYREALQMMKLLPETRITGDMTKIAAELFLNDGQMNDALKWSNRAVENDSKKYEDHLWKGQISSIAGVRKEAEESLRKAITLAEGKQGKAWLTLVQHFVRNREASSAAQAVAEARSKLPANNTWIPLCLEAIEKYDEAGNEFLNLVRAQPKDPSVLRAAADYFVRRNDGKAAEPLLNQIIDMQDKSAGDKAWATRTLAVILASRGDYHQSRKALALLGLLDSNDKIITKISANESIEEMRARAVVFGLNRSRTLRQEATNVLEQLAIRQARTNDDLFFQARLHNDLGDWGKCRDCLQALLTREMGNTESLEFMIRNLLLHNDVNTAKLYLERLEKKQPDSDLTIDLLARVRKASGDDSGALALIEKHFLQTNPPRPEKAAELLEDMRLIEPAESIYRRLARESAKPETNLNLAKFLGRQKKLKEALQLCKAVRSTALLEEVAFISIEALYHSPQRSGEDMDEIGIWLESLVAARRSAPRLKLLGAMRNLQGRYEESIKAYMEVVNLDKNDIGSRNNLAFLLAMQQKQFPEALQHLADALQIVGPHPDLLDTRALVYLQMNKPDQAMDELLQAMDQDPSAMAHFHLACVHKAKRSRQYAMNAWEEMKRRKLFREDVHPLEWPAYDALAQEFDGGILPAPPKKTAK